MTSVDISSVALTSLLAVPCGPQMQGQQCHQLEVTSPAPTTKEALTLFPPRQSQHPMALARDVGPPRPVSPGPVCPTAFSLGLGRHATLLVCLLPPSSCKLKLFTRPQGFNYLHADRPPTSDHHLISFWGAYKAQTQPVMLNSAAPAHSFLHPDLTS